MHTSDAVACRSCTHVLPMTLRGVPGSQARKDGKAPAMALCTPLDPSGGAWTRSHPGAPVVARLGALARRSLAVLQACMEHLLALLPDERQCLWSVFASLLHSSLSERMQHAAKLPGKSSTA